MINAGTKKWSGFFFVVVITLYLFSFVWQERCGTGRSCFLVPSITQWQYFPCIWDFYYFRCLEIWEWIERKKSNLCIYIFPHKTAFSSFVMFNLLTYISTVFMIKLIKFTPSSFYKKKYQVDSRHYLFIYSQWSFSLSLPISIFS